MSTPYNDENCMAFAALCACVVQVNKLAYGKQTDKACIDSLLNSILVLDANQAQEIYPVNWHQLQTEGREVFKSEDQLQLVSYIAAIIKIRKILLQRPDLLNKIRSLVEKIDLVEPEHLSENPAAWIQLSEVYRQTVGQLDKKIMVNGHPHVLGNSQNTALIRSLLLAGIRACFLWHQTGGRQWQLMFSRKKLMHCLERRI